MRLDFIKFFYGHCYKVKYLFLFQVSDLTEYNNFWNQPQSYIDETRRDDEDQTVSEYVP